MSHCAGSKSSKSWGIGPGPFAGVFLAELGAEVTLIKRPDPETRDDPLERGKRTVLLDLKSDEGRAHLLALAATKAPTSASPLLSPEDAARRIVDFEVFRPTLVAALAHGDGTKVGRPPSPRLTGMGHSLGPAAASVCGMATGLCEIDLPSAREIRLSGLSGSSARDR